MKRTVGKRKGITRSLYSRHEKRHYVTGLGIASVFDIAGSIFEPFERHIVAATRYDFMKNAWITVGNSIRAATEKAASESEEGGGARSFTENR